MSSTPKIFEQNYMALQALGHVTLVMHRPGEWYCDVQGVETTKVGHPFLTSKSTSGENPEEAIVAEFEYLTNLGPEEYIVLHAMTGQRRHVVWNGFMWADSIHEVPSLESIP